MPPGQADPGGCGLGFRSSRTPHLMGSSPGCRCTSVYSTRPFSPQVPLTQQSSPRVCRALVHEGESKSCKASDVRPGGHAASLQCLLWVRASHRSAQVAGRGGGCRLSRGAAGGHLWKHFRSKLEPGLGRGWFLPGVPAAQGLSTLQVTDVGSSSLPAEWPLPIR